VGVLLALLRFEGVGELGHILGHGQGVKAADDGTRTVHDAHFA
jgi:hypothetical protein